MTTVHESGANFNEMTSEQKVAFFEGLGISNPQINPDGYEFFAFIVDQKVSAIFVASKENMQEYITAFSSNPVVVKLTSAQKNLVQTGWDYNSESGELSQP